MSDRPMVLEAFLADAGWGAAAREPLAGDASLRRYIRLTDGTRRAMLMDAPPDTGEDVRPFLRVAGLLTARGLTVPEVLASDAEAGLLLLEDLGDAVFSRVCARSPDQEAPLYAAAGAALGQMQQGPAPDLPTYAPLMADLAGLALDWYAPRRRDARDALTEAMADALDDPALRPWVFTHRDFHADNLIWLPERVDVARVGLLDFQDAMQGPAEYDLASLIHDPRRVVAAEAAAAAIESYLAATGRAPEVVARGVAICSAQRCLRILGVFARLCLRDGKAHYPDFIPRTWQALQRDLQHPALAAVKQVVDETLPVPTEKILTDIRAGAGSLSGRPHGGAQ